VEGARGPETQPARSGERAGGCVTCSRASDQRFLHFCENDTVFVSPVAK
jgi:hypothetical protein